MTVRIQEFITITDIDGVQHEGEAVATNLVAIKKDEDYLYGAVVKINRVHTTIVCDNDKCVNSSVNDKFETIPRTIEFDDNGSTDPTFLATMAGIVIASDYQGNKKAFCSEECASDFLKRQVRAAKVIDFPAGKGKKSELS